MTGNKTFQIALLASVLVHFVLFLGAPNVPFAPSSKPPEAIKVTYRKIKGPPKKITGQKPEAIVTRLPEIKKEEILNPPPAAVSKAEVKAKGGAGIKEVKEKKFEAIVSEEQNSEKKASYISYYGAVRERIKECADKNYPKDSDMGDGEIFLSFAVASSGELLQVRVIEEKSTKSEFLRNVAINSVRDASPFPAFPSGMSQYQITFNVIISFEFEK